MPPHILIEDPLVEHVFLPPSQPQIWRNFIFFHYDYVYTQQDVDEGFEWWFPKANGGGSNLVILHATIEVSKRPSGTAFMALFLQSEHHEHRVLVEVGENRKGFHKTPEFIVPHKSRSVLVLNGLLKDTALCVSYLMERV